MIPTKREADLQAPDFCNLRQALRNVRFDLQIGKEDLLENERLRKRHDDVLRSIHCIFRSWRYFSKIKGKHTLNTARLLVPEEVKGAVVLDATAPVNLVYRLFDNAMPWTPPKGARNYRNVTLHVSQGHKVGKGSMEADPHGYCKKLIQELNPKLKGRQVLVVTHLRVEPVLTGYTPDFTMQVGHWGKVDGSNDWRDCDTCIVFGLQYRPDWWTANVFMAYQGPRDTEWLRSDSRPFAQYQDIRQALKLGQLTTDIVQAINRVQCRKVIDELGNCPETQVYLMLPKDGIGNAILQGIKKEMPGVKVEDWQFTKQDVKKKRIRRSNHEEALLRYLQNMDTGRQSRSRIQRELGIPETSMERLISKVRQSDSRLSTVMLENGVTLDISREGKVSRLYFVKK